MNRIKALLLLFKIAIGLHRHRPELGEMQMEVLDGGVYIYSGKTYCMECEKYMNCIVVKGSEGKIQWNLLKN